MGRKASSEVMKKKEEKKEEVKEEVEDKSESVKPCSRGFKEGGRSQMDEVEVRVREWLVAARLGRR